MYETFRYTPHAISVFFLLLFFTPIRDKMIESRLVNLEEMMRRGLEEKARSISFSV